MVEAVCAVDLKERGLLAGDTVVSTVMCNLGFVHAMRDAGIAVVQTKVGDRYVLEEMRKSGYVLGGEQSGHMIFLEHNSTGDGLVTALQFLAACKRAGKPAAEMARVMTRFPQRLINVRVKDKHALPDCAPVWDAGEGCRRRARRRRTCAYPHVWHGTGCARHVEAADEAQANEVCERLAQVVEAELGA